MNYRIDNLQYCNWSRDIFLINREAGLNAVHVTLVYHEDYDEFLQRVKEWDRFFEENSDLIFLGKTFEDITKAQNKGYEIWGQVSCRPLTMEFTMNEPYMLEGLVAWKDYMIQNIEQMMSLIASILKKDQYGFSEFVKFTREYDQNNSLDITLVNPEMKVFIDNHK